MDEFENKYQERVAELQRANGALYEQISSLKREVEWYKRIIENLSRREYRHD